LVSAKNLSPTGPARLLTVSNKQSHITSIVGALRWLPVCFRIDFKILLITFKAFMGLAPSYMSKMLIPYEPHCSLRSSGGTFLAVLMSTLTSRGDRAFAVRAPRLLNHLPEQIRLAESVTSFKSLLKTHFYRSAFM